MYRSHRDHAVPHLTTCGLLARRSDRPGAVRRRCPPQAELSTDPGRGCHRPRRGTTVVGMAAKDVLGRRGEDLAAHYLEQRGLVVLSRNWRCRHGEIDLVATDARLLVVCEVKTRSGTRYGEPA